MSRTNNAICKICGTPYYMCLSCKEFRRLYPYKLHTDTAEHFKIYQILQGYSTKVYTKEEAKMRLQNVDLSDIESFKGYVRDNIKELLQEDKSHEFILDDEMILDKEKGNEYFTEIINEITATDVKAED